MTIFLLSHVFLVPQKGETTTEKRKNLCYFLFQLIILNCMRQEGLRWLAWLIKKIGFYYFFIIW